jgi:hypothetical protein
MNGPTNKLVKGVKSVSGFLSDALDAFKDSKFLEALAKSTPWVESLGGAAAEAIPPLKFFTKIAEDLLKETDPEKLGFTACTLAFQNAVILSIEKNPGPAGKKQSIREAKEQLKEVGGFDDVDMGTFSLDKPLEHEFYRQSVLCLEIAAQKVGYVKTDIDNITAKTGETFKNSLIKILSSGNTKDKFSPFTEYLKLGGAEEKRARMMLAQHANYQRWLFEQAPVLKISPFALKHIYIDTDCKKTTWGELNKTNLSPQDKAKFLDDSSDDRQPLLKSVIDLIKSPVLSDAIIIQGTAGSGKSSFTLKLYNELLKRRLHPIRIRIGDLSFSSNTHIEDELPRAVKFGDENFLSAFNTSEDLFLNGSIFSEKGPGEFSHISKYVLILDGWDEISLSNEGFKNKVAQMLTQINDSYLKKTGPRVRVILTGRPSSDIGDTKCLRENSPFINILRFTPGQLKNYISNLRNAVNAEITLIPKNELTEKWTVPDETRFEPIIKQYETAFKGKNKGQSSELDILGLPLLTNLTVRLVAEWKGDLSPLLENTTTLYRHLIDLTCKKAGKVGDEKGDEHKYYSNELRRLLRKTAHAITISGSENISRKELISRLDFQKENFDDSLSDLEKENKLSSLLISFYFKGGHSHLGCEFAHKSFREYLFAEAIVGCLKSYGVEQTAAMSPRANYWDDFSDNNPNDHRFSLSRDLAMLLAPQWITAEVSKHVIQLLKWEIGRAFSPNTVHQSGTPTTGISIAEWRRIRDGLADLWGWWGEGGHLRPQRHRDFYDNSIKTSDAYVNKLILWDSPRDERIDKWGFARTTTMDAHLGDALFMLCASVHAEMGDMADDETPDEKDLGEYQSLRTISQKRIVVFRPSGNHSYYFKYYTHRINSAGWRPNDVFPAGRYMKNISLSGAALQYSCFDNTNLENADFQDASFAHASFYNSYLKGSDFRRAEVFLTDFVGAKLIGTNFNEAFLGFSNFIAATILNTRMGNADITGIHLNGAVIDREFIKADGFQKAVFDHVIIDGKPFKRDEVFKLLTQEPLTNKQ